MKFNVTGNQDTLLLLICSNGVCFYCLSVNKQDPAPQFESEAYNI